MRTVEDELHDLLRERATPPPAPPGRYESVRRRARSRRRRQVAAAGAGTALVVVAALAVPLMLRAAPRADQSPPVAAPLHPPAGQLTRLERVVATGSEIKIGLTRGACTPQDIGVAWLAHGEWRLAVWTPQPATPTPRLCTDQLIGYTLSLPLSQPYAGEPVIDEASGASVEVNGGPGFPLPAYLPPGYQLAPSGMDKGPLSFAGPQGPILVQVGGPEMGTIHDQPGWPYDVLGRPDINGHQGILVRYRNDGDNTMLRWVDGTGRGIMLQIFSAALDPQELVKIARSMR
jgi:hypothetical protein